MKIRFKAASAADVLEERAKLLEKLRKDEDRLEALVKARVDAESELATASASTDEEADTSAAEGRVNGVKRKIADHIGRLSALRLRLARQVEALEKAHRSVTEALPGFTNAIKEEFSKEWAAGVAAFAELLGKRKAIEALTGRLELAEPKPTAQEIPDLALPWSLLDSLGAGLEELSSWSRAVDAPLFDSMTPGPHPAFDRDAVHVAVSDLSSAPAGTLLVEGSFVPGVLEHMFNIGYVARYDSLRWAEALGAARLAQSRIEGERRAARLVSDMRPDLAYPPEVFERSQRANVEGQRRAMNERGDNMPKPIGSQPGEAPAEFQHNSRRAEKAGIGQ